MATFRPVEAQGRTGESRRWQCWPQCITTLSRCSAGRIYKLPLTIPRASQTRSSTAVSDGWIQGHMVVLQLQGKLGKRGAGFYLGKARNPKRDIPKVSSAFRSTMHVVHLHTGPCSVPYAFLSLFTAPLLLMGPLVLVPWSSLVYLSSTKLFPLPPAAPSFVSCNAWTDLCPSIH